MAKHATEASLSSIREGLLKSVQPKRVPITYNGVELELVQPTVGEIQAMRTEADTDNKIDGFVRIMIRFAVIPGTDTKPLTEEDAPVLLEKPWDHEVVKIIEAFGKLSDIDVSGEAKNSEPTAS